MTTISENYEQAQLAQAAYALDLVAGMTGADNSDYTKLLKAAGFTESQAKEFANSYTVVAQYPGTDDGFSATIFNKDGVNYFAIRGSEAHLDDWLGSNFGDIGADGIAIEQSIDMFNWLQWLVSPANTEVVQAKTVSMVVRAMTGFPVAIIRNGFRDEWNVREESLMIYYFAVTARQYLISIKMRQTGRHGGII